MLKVLVTGADGFIGSHLVDELLKQNYKVKALVFYNSFNFYGWLTPHPNLEIVCGDIRDSFFVDNLISDCDAVMHLAALIAIPYSYIAPSSYVETNINGTLNILEASKKHNLQKIVITSTSEVYGTPLSIPISEDAPLNAQSPYAASKVAADQMALAYHKSFNLPVAVIRPFNTYGPRQSIRAIIPVIITQTLLVKPTLEIGSLTPTRDFNYVEDTVRGFISILENPASVGEVINIGSGKETSLAELISLFNTIIPTPPINISTKHLRPTSSEVMRLCADNNKAHSILNWTPQVSLQEGLTKTISWFHKNLNKYNIQDSFTL